MNNQFLEAYIHLEKLCNEIYGTKNGISKYIEDMEQTNINTQIHIPLWSTTYKRLKEIRWKRNQFVHQGNVEYNDDDIKWLMEFYQLIFTCEDPLSKKSKFQEKTSSGISKKNQLNIETYTWQDRAIESDKNKDLQDRVTESDKNKNWQDRVIEKENIEINNTQTAIVIAIILVAIFIACFLMILAL